MNLSISNSDMNTNSERKIYLRIFLAMALGMVAALALVRWFTWMRDISGEAYLGHVLQARAALPRITKAEGDLVMMYGSSMVASGFSPRQFEREVNKRGGKISAWNFGFGGLNPFFQDYLSRRIRETLQENDRLLKLALIEFNPFQTTQTRWNGAKHIVDSYITLLASPEELLEIALQDPERGALLYNIKYLRDNVSAEMITTFVSRKFQEPQKRSSAPNLDEESQARLDEISDLLKERFKEDYPDWNGSKRNYDWQGAGPIPEERSGDTVDLQGKFYALNRYQQRMENDLLNRIQTADILNLEFEELLIEHFIAIVENFKQVSYEVEVILLPRNIDWIQYTPEVAARLQEVIVRIERKTGVKVVNHQVIDMISPDMFRDTTHLGRYIGDVPYTDYLVEQYAERLID